MSHHYGHYQEKGESDEHYVKRTLGAAMLGIATASEGDWYQTHVWELDSDISFGSEYYRRMWGQRIVQRIFQHAYRGKR